MPSIKKFLLAGIFLSFFASSLAALDKTTAIAKFQHKHRLLETLSRRMNNLRSQGEENQKIDLIFSKHIHPLFEMTTKLDRILTQKNYNVDDDFLELLEQFEDQFKHYDELIGLINSYLLQVEQIYTMQDSIVK